MALGAVCMMDWPVIGRLKAGRPGGGYWVVLLTESLYRSSRDGGKVNCRDVKERKLIICEEVTLSVVGLGLPGSATYYLCKLGQRTTSPL